MGKKAVFFDRDDTLISDSGYMSRPEQVNLLPGVPEALIQLKRMGYLLVVVTNQSGIARGLLTEADLEKIHQELKRQLASENAAIDAIYYCPYHPDGEIKDFSVESNLRKPNAGMFFQAEKDLDIDLPQSWMIGDSYRDVQAGNAAGCHTILVDVPGKVPEKKKNDSEPDRKAVNLREAVNIIRMYEFHQKANSAKQTSAQAPDPKEPAEAPDPEPADLPKPPFPEVPEPPTTEPEDLTVAAAVEDVPAEKSSPEPPKVYSAKKLSEIETSQQGETGSEMLRLLEQITLRLNRKDREGLYQEFSVFKLFSLMFQVIAIFCLIISLCFWLSPKVTGSEPVLIMIGYAVALQLMVIALLMMHSRD